MLHGRRVVGTAGHCLKRLVQGDPEVRGKGEGERGWGGRAAQVCGRGRMENEEGHQLTGG